MNGLISVVIPAYNSESYINKTIECAKRQTYSNIEIIVVDDGSTDRTHEVATSAATSDSRVKILKQINQRVGAARNYGLRQASGRFVAFLDSDDLWHPTTLQRHLEILLGEPNGKASFCHHRVIDVHDRILFSETYWPVKQFNFGAHLVMQPVRNGSSLVVDRELAMAVGGFISRYRSCEDLDFELKIAARSPIRVVPEYLVGYRRSPENMSSNKQHMIEGIVGVMSESMQANQHLPRRTKAWTRGRLHEDAAFNAWISGDRRTMFRHCLQFAKCDPVSLAWRTAEKLSELLVTQFGQSRRDEGIQNADFMSADPVHFAPESALDWLRYRRLLHLLAE